MFQLPSSCRQPRLAVFQSRPNAAEGCPPLGWSPGLRYNAQLFSFGTFSSVNASSGETMSVQAAEAKLACPSIWESMSPTERNKIHCWSLSTASRALLDVPYSNLETLLAKFRNVCEPCPCTWARVAQPWSGSTTIDVPKFLRIWI